MLRPSVSKLSGDARALEFEAFSEYVGRIAAWTIPPNARSNLGAPSFSLCRAQGREEAQSCAGRPVQLAGDPALGDVRDTVIVRILCSR
jgi:hypothetical protein